MVVDDWKKDESDERRQYGASKRILFIYLNVKKKNFVGCAGREEYDTSLPRRKRLTFDDDEVIRVMGGIRIRPLPGNAGKDRVVFVAVDG